MLEFIETLWKEIIIAIILGLGSLVVHYLKKRVDTIKEVQKEIINLRKFKWRITKAIIIFAKLIDDQTEKSHDDVTSELEEIVKELLDIENTEKNNTRG